jgi:hypothetical protein
MSANENSNSEVQDVDADSSLTSPSGRVSTIDSGYITTNDPVTATASLSWAGDMGTYTESDDHYIWCILGRYTGHSLTAQSIFISLHDYHYEYSTTVGGTWCYVRCYTGDWCLYGCLLPIQVPWRPPNPPAFLSIESPGVRVGFGSNICFPININPQSACAYP